MRTFRHCDHGVTYLIGTDDEDALHRERLAGSRDDNRRSQNRQTHEAADFGKGPLRRGPKDLGSGSDVLSVSR